MQENFLLQFLGQVKIFNNLTDEEKLRIIKVCKITQYKKGDVVFVEGAGADAVYFIENGMVKVTKSLSSGGEKALATLAKGAIFGEMALIDDQERSAKVTVLSNLNVYKLRKADFDELRKNNDTGANKIVREMSYIIAGRLRNTNKKISQMFDDPTNSIEEFKKQYAKMQGDSN
ncbi:MAG: cyclic nucleotide-binding domain-containing protein [Pseudomonadota bacterium]